MFYITTPLVGLIVEDEEVVEEIIHMTMIKFHFREKEGVAKILTPHFTTELRCVAKNYKIIAIRMLRALLKGTAYALTLREAKDVIDLLLEINYKQVD